ncbi:hypothetical protein FISHEDRAFT_73975 [Fistulina hepatica ATCC 64428]|uniref:DUF6534 domain-containing protein n=1 Tax=Fistulina hepatica ATCC 64428 TaxID=1128425 RepID=A0A0D7ADW6_9AGAR|nr:hypothetical protein FISHEDRAFT_73975 [Fistulina hepatica ATCC 64428]
MAVLDDSMGCLFVTNVLTAALWGAMGVQTYLYTITYWKRDGWKLKTMVYFVSILDTMHQVILSIAVYGYLVTNWGDEGFDQRDDTSCTYTFLLSGRGLTFLQAIIILITQSFMVYRIYACRPLFTFSFCSFMTVSTVCHNPVLVGILEASVVAYFGIVVCWIVKSMSSSAWVELEAFRSLIVAMNALGATNDVVVAAVFSYLLHTSKTGFASTSHMINRIIVMSINTGTITAMFSIAALISIVVRGDALIYAIFWLVAGRLYSNSLLGILNARNFLRRPGPDSTDYPSFTASSGARTGISSDPSAGSRNARMLAIRMDISKEQNADDDIPMDVSDRLD